MAVARVGGTRAKLRGKVGSEIYQLVVDSTGKWQQVIRAAEESRINNNTMAQAIARMTIATLERAMHQFKQILDVAIEGATSVNDSFSKFVQLNYGYVLGQVEFIPDAIAEGEWLWDVYYNFPMKGVASVLGGAWQISAGTLRYTWRDVQRVGYDGMPSYRVEFQPLGDRHTFGQFMRLHQMQIGDYWTAVFITENGQLDGGCVHFLRISPNYDWQDSDIITPDNVTDLFRFAGNAGASAQVMNGFGQVSVSWVPSADMAGHRITSWGIIKSCCRGGHWLKSNCTMNYDPDAFDRYHLWRSPYDVWPSWYQQSEEL